MFLLILEIDTPSGSRKTLYPLRKLAIFNGVLIFETLPRGTWRLDQGAGLIGATVGSFLVLFILSHWPRIGEFESIWLADERPKALIFRHVACEHPALLTSKTNERDNAPTRATGVAYAKGSTGPQTETATLPDRTACRLDRA